VNEFPDQHDPMEISEAELRGLTQDLGDVHADTLPRMHDALEEWNDSSVDLRGGLTQLASASTSRRRFLLGAGAAFGGAALVASGVGGGLAAASTKRSRRAGWPTKQQKLSGDLAIVAVAAALENLAVGTYQAGIDAATAGKLGTVPPAVVEFAKTAQSQHKDHAAAWNAVLTGAGKKKVTGVDLTVKPTVDQTFAQVTDVPGLAKLALTLENVAAATYLSAIDVVKSPAGIRTAATIQPVEMQHAAILNFLLGQYPVPDSFSQKTGAVSGTDKIG
jgi:Ferritin-like domain